MANRFHRRDGFREKTAFWSLPLFLHNFDPVCSLDRKGNILAVNPAYEKMSGYLQEDLASSSWFMLLVPEFRQNALRHFEIAIQGEIQEIETVLRHRTGVDVQAIVKFVPVWAKKSVSLVYGIIRDFTASREAREAIITHTFYVDNAEEETNRRNGYYRLTLKEENVGLEKERNGIADMVSWGPVNRNGGVVKGIASSTEGTERDGADAAWIEPQTMSQILLEESLMGVYIVQNGKFSYVNSRFAEMLGYRRDELTGADVMDLVYEDDRQMIAEALNKRRKNAHYQVRLYKKDRSVLEVEALVSSTVYNGKLVYIGTIVNISEQKRAEELLRQSDQLALIGQLAAGVAHEIRNPLTALKGFIQLLKSKSAENREYFDIMESELDRIHFIVNEMLLLAKPRAAHFQKRNLSVLLQHVVALLENQAIMHNVQIVTQFDSELPEILCEENQLKQVFINIVKNAIEAMPDGGKLYIKAKTKNEKVLIRFIDQGKGMTAEQIAKLGEPFYTTKEKGTGLGMMVSLKIIKDHQGSIKIKSVENIGTIVEVTLPLCAEGKTAVAARH